MLIIADKTPRDAEVEGSTTEDEDESEELIDGDEQTNKDEL